MWLSSAVRTERAVIHLLFILITLSMSSSSFLDLLMLNDAD